MQMMQVGHTALMYALNHRHGNVAALLLQHNADPMHRARVMKNIQIYKFLIISVCIQTGESALMAAVRASSNCVEELLRFNAANCVNTEISVS